MIVLEIERRIGAEFGAAVGSFWDTEGHEDDGPLASGPMITGPRYELDPREYGAVIPPGEWIPVEPLGERDYPKVMASTFSRLMPTSGQQITHPRRTYGIHRKDPFQSHDMGSSSGCVGPISFEDWKKDYKRIYNDAVENKGLLITINDEKDVDLGEWEDAFEVYGKAMERRGL